MPGVFCKLITLGIGVFETISAAAPSANNKLATIFCASRSLRKCNEHNSTHTSNTTAPSCRNAAPEAASSPQIPPKQPMNPICEVRTFGASPDCLQMSCSGPGDSNPVQVTTIKSVISCGVRLQRANACSMARAASAGACCEKHFMRWAVVNETISCSGMTAARRSMPQL